MTNVNRSRGLNNGDFKCVYRVHQFLVAHNGSSYNVFHFVSNVIHSFIECVDVCSDVRKRCQQEHYTLKQFFEVAICSLRPFVAQTTNARDI